MSTRHLLSLAALVLVSCLHPAAEAQPSQARGPSEEAIEAEIRKQHEAKGGGQAAIDALEAAYKARLQANKDDHDTRFYYANFLGLLDREDDCRVELQKILERVPGYVPAYHRMGVYYKNKKQYDRAISELKRGLEFKADDVQLNLALADIYVNHLREYDKAEAPLKAVLALRPTSRMAHHRLGKVLYERGRKLDEGGKQDEARRNYGEAINHFNEVLQVSPDAVDLTAGLNYFWLGHAYYHSAKLSEAYDAFRLAVRLLPPTREKERALENIQAIATELGRDPVWDSLRVETKHALNHKDDQPEDDHERRYQGALTLCEYFRKTGSPDAMAMMVEALERPHPDLAVRVLIARSLGLKGLEAKIQAQVGEHLLRVLRQSSEAELVRASAAYGLAALGWDGALPALVETLSTDSRYLFNETLAALESLAGTEQPSIAVVADGDSDTEFEQRVAVRGAWKQWWENSGKK